MELNKEDYIFGLTFAIVFLSFSFAWYIILDLDYSFVIYLGNAFFDIAKIGVFLLYYILGLSSLLCFFELYLFLTKIMNKFLGEGMNE